MNKYIKLFSVLFLGLLLLQSCDDFLETEPRNGVDASSAIKTESDMKAAITGVYAGLINYKSYGRNTAVFGDVLTSNVMISPTNSNRFTSLANWSWNNATSDIEYFWDYSYQIINAANNIINATDVSGKKENIEQLLGEAYAIRALVYFDLVRMFAQDYNYTTDHSHPGVPYVKVHDPKGTPGRNTVAEVYSNIFADLEQAAKLVTFSRSKTPYTITPNAINALYARLYLSTGDYSNALKKAELVIPESSSIQEYSLVPNSEYIASWGKETTSESIFTLSQTNLTYPSTNALGYIYIETGYGDLLVSNEYIGLFDKSDIRSELFVSGKKDNTKSRVYIGKYPGRGTPGLDNYNVIRLSEIYLIASEAAARLSNETKAIKYLDIIRLRAQPTAAVTTVSGDALINAILLEKRKELGFEGHYYHDLKRLQLPINGAYSGTGIAGKVINYGDNLRAWPIPLREINANSTIKEQQNPGY